MNDDRATYSQLVHAFTTFLTVATHTILYERHIYPVHSFISARKYNYAVKQCRHPRVCEWISDATAAVETEILKCAVDRVAVVIYDGQERPLERFLFDVSKFPIVPINEHNTPLQTLDDDGTEVAALPVGNLEEQFRAAMSRLSGCGARLKDIPQGCTYTMAVELKNGSEPPLGEPQAWIPAQPGLQRSVQHRHNATIVRSGRELGGAKTIPIRSVAAGEMVVEIWVEEGRAKFQASVTEC